MRGVCLLVALLCASAYAHAFGRFPTPKNANVKRSSTDYKTLWYNQTLDHFNWNSQPQYYLQRYLISDKYWGSTSSYAAEGCKGPIFFYTGNEGDVTLFWDNSGFVTDYLPPLFGALIVFAEHRYYGESLPFGDNSFTNQNMQYLSSEQALADYAELLTYIKDTLPGAQNCPIISFGGSYGGMLTAWFRLKYPHITAGGIAASAPILQFYNTGVSEWIYMQITTDDYTNANCSSQIHDAFSLVLKLGQSSSGLAQLSNTFKLCQPLNTYYDAVNFALWIASGFQYMAMIDYPYPTNFLEPVPAWPVQVSCQTMLASLSSNNDLLEGLAAAIGVYYNYTGTTTCYNLNDTATPSLGTAAWNYQSCTEMVMPISSNGTSDMFVLDRFVLDQFVQSCQQQFGVTPRANWVTTYYGGRATPRGPDIQGSNIVFSNGRLDPWRGGGVQQTLSDSLVAVIIEEGAHHLDLRTPNPADPQSVKDARALEISHIKKWIKQYYIEH